MLKLDWNLVFTIINLIVLYLLMQKFLYHPIMNIILQREQLIKEQLNAAKNTEEEALALKQKYEVSMANVEKEANLILDRTRNRAQKEYDQILLDADMAAKKAMKETEKAIETEWKKSIQSVSDEIAELAVSVAERAVKKQNSGMFDQNLMKTFLKEEGVCNEQYSR